MKTELVKETIEINVANIPTMQSMSSNEYTDYLYNLIFTDTHGIIRSTQGEYPIACNQEQVKILINYLTEKSQYLD